MVDVQAVKGHFLLGEEARSMAYIYCIRHDNTGYIGKDLYCYDFTPLETPWIPLKNNDMIFLLTDGIYESCDEMDLQKAVNIKNTTINCCKSLINVATQKGASDDLTAVGSAFYTFD